MNPAIDFIFQNGKIYQPGWPPKDMIRGEIGHCFDTCALNAIQGKYSYVEGYAEDPDKKGRFLLHAWITDGEHAFDPTWLAYRFECSLPVPTFYIGLEIETRAMAQFFGKTKYAGVLANAWRDPMIARACLPKGFPITDMPQQIFIK